MKVIAEIEKFQSTLPREERHNTTGWQGTGEIISIHAPTRGATIRITVGLLITQNFNPRSHERSDYDSIGITLIHENFNPRSHERSDRMP